MASASGAGPWARFVRVTLPLMSPALLLMATRDTILSFQATFVPALLVTEGGPPPYGTTYLPLFVYRNAFEYLRYGYASAATVLMFVLTASIVWLQYRLIERRRRRASAQRRPRVSEPDGLGEARRGDHEPPQASERRRVGEHRRAAAAAPGAHRVGPPAFEEPAARAGRAPTSKPERDERSRCVTVGKAQPLARGAGARKPKSTPAVMSATRRGEQILDERCAGYPWPVRPSPAEP